MLNLEEDLLLAEQDFAAMRSLLNENSIDLQGYLDFLEAIGAFDGKKPDAKLYAEMFELVD